jgi:hypothetical protein
MVAITWPDVELLPMYLVLGSMAVLLPLITYGSAYLIWQSIDIVMRPPTPDDFEIVATLDSDPADIKLL